MNSLQGHLLVASAELGDPNFARTVLLLVKHNEEGAFGLVLNRVSNTPIGEVWKQISTAACQSAEMLRVGGPIQGPLMALHDRPALGELEVVPGVYFVAGTEPLEALVADTGAATRFFVGYSGWGPGQLESELAEGAWGTIEASSERVFSEPAEIWEAMQATLGGSRWLSALGIKHVPSDPRLN